MVNEIRTLLRAARENLDMDVAFVGQFVEDQRLFRYVDSEIDPPVIREGDSSALASSYCQAVVDGRLPSLVGDTSTNAVARSLEARRRPVKSHISVPIRMSDGSVFGTFCCFGYESKPSLNERDLAMLRTFAAITAGRLEQNLTAEQRRAGKLKEIRTMLASGGPSIVYQPVFMLDDMRLVGAEALSRFPSGTGRRVDAWFRDAAEVGLQTELELQAIANAIDGYRAVWKSRRIQLGINASATTITDPRLETLLQGSPRELLVIELTEHEEVQDYESLLEATRRLRRFGTRIAVDDVGAGYASMRHVLTIRPDILKLDIGLVQSIDTDDLKLALVSSLKHFADRFDCKIIAEGIETLKELTALRQLGLQGAQGFLLGRPAGAGDLMLDRADCLEYA